MKKIIYTLLALTTIAVTMVSCHDVETYAELREKEKNAITRFITDSTITVINEEQFEKQGYTTDISRNEYVLFEQTGLYMQIVRKGEGKEFKPGDIKTLICRFREYNVLGDSLQLSNLNHAYASRGDKMVVRYSSGAFSGTFDTTQSLLYEAYNSAAVPAGWLTPLRYIRPARTAPDGEAFVKVIVPAAQGQSSAAANTYPCYYELYYELDR